MKRMKKRKPRHFIVQHDLMSLRALPSFIWNTQRHTQSYDQVQRGSRWIAYAYIRDEDDREPCSLITGIYQCAKTCWRGDVPLDKATLVGMGYDTPVLAWMIQARLWAAAIRAYRTPAQSHRTTSHRVLSPQAHLQSQALVPITADNFERLRSYALQRDSRSTSVE